MFTWITVPVRSLPFRITRQALLAHFIFQTVLLIVAVANATEWEALQASNSSDSISNYSLLNAAEGNEEKRMEIPVIYDSSSMDSLFQTELLKSALVGFGSHFGNGHEHVQTLPLDFARFDSGDKTTSLRESVKYLITNKFKVAVSILNGEDFQKFEEIYEELARNVNDEDTELVIYSPRSHLPRRHHNKPRLVHLKSLQMSEEGKSIALLNRVSKVGVQVLIPVLDGDSQFQSDLLQLYHKSAGLNPKFSKIKFTNPILLNDPTHTSKLERILEDSNSFHEGHLSSLGFHHHRNPFEFSHSKTAKPGILLLAMNASQSALQIAAQKNHVLLSWFSPNLLEFEEWAQNQQKLAQKSQNSSRMSDFMKFQNVEGNVSNSKSQTKAGQQQDNLLKEEATGGEVQNESKFSSFFGLYTVNFVGSSGWDNPNRRKMLRELSLFTGPSPRISSSILAYDSVQMAISHFKEGKISLPRVGLSGKIDFCKEGFRKSGTYLGTSSVSNLLSNEVSLLQPSTWVLEDVITERMNKLGKSLEIIDYDIATSSILSRNELQRIANSTKYQAGCKEHLMNVVTYDPYTQMPYHYFFNEESLPQTLVVPNHQGFGITFTCTHETNQLNQSENANEVTTMQIGCTPGAKMTHPISCFRSHINRRQKRAAATARGVDPKAREDAIPSVQYQYSLSGNDPWNSNDYYYQTADNKDFQADAIPYTHPSIRLDNPAPASEAPPTPVPAGPPPKLPELRTILKAAKPFVGSCIGSSTGCAICVLVLGRLPLGTAPSACTGPCFVGTFGSCGSLLGRVFAETTVICTELFKQGLIDTDTFVADAEFGKYMLDSSPYTLQGYTLLATPLVTLMKSSKFITSVVATFALPWAHHMKYLLGRSDETNMIGSLVHSIGYPICNLTGRLYFIVFHLQTMLLSYLPLIISILSSLLTILLALTVTTNFNLFSFLLFSTSKISKRSKIYQNLTITAMIDNFGGELISKITTLKRNVGNYFKAIGKRT